MNKIVISLCLLILSSCAQKIISTSKVTEYSVHIIGNDFEGAVFSNAYLLPTGMSLSSLSAEVRIDLSAKEILTAEKLLVNSGDVIYLSYPISKYYRQYFGYLNEKKQRIVYINFFWKEDEYLTKSQVPAWQRELIYAFNGGNHYWRIKVNLDTGKLFDFSENDNMG